MAGTSNTCASFTVPGNQRLVAQHVAGGAIVPAGKELAASVSGQNAIDDDDMFVPVAFRRESLGPTQDRLQAAQDTLFYVEEGFELRVCFQPLPLSDSFEFSGNLTISGYLERR